MTSSGRTDGSINPLAFVGGCPRSGTTLLQRMLDSHPQLACANDTHFIPRMLEKYSPSAVDLAIDGCTIPLTRTLVKGTLDYHRFRRLGVSTEEACKVADQVTTYQAFVRGLYDCFAEHHGKPFAAEKTPDYVRHTQLLAGLFPQSRFVHIWRDGRDVALSLLDWATPTKGPGRLALWKSQPLATAALWWQEFVLRGRHEGPAAFGDRYLELSYEALLQDPNGQVERVTTHLGLPFDPCMLEFYRGKTQVLPDRSAKQNWLPPIQGLRDWRQTMSHADVQLFEAIAGDSLEQLGYLRVHDRCEPQIADMAEQARTWWLHHRPWPRAITVTDDMADEYPTVRSAG